MVVSGPAAMVILTHRTEEPMRRTHLLLLIVPTILLAACGGGDGDETAGAPAIEIEGATTASADTAPSAAGDSAAAPTDDTPTDEELSLQFAECMRDEGIDFVDPEVGADGSIDLQSGFQNIDPADGQDAALDAFEACDDILAGTSLLPTAEGAALNEEALLDFAACLRDEGLDVTDPDVNALGGGAVTPTALFGENFNPGDPDTQAAVQACVSILADAGLGPGA